MGVAISPWAAFQLAFILVPLPTRLAELDSPVMLYDNDEIAHVGLAQDQRWRFRVDLDEIDPKYVSALLTIEDSRFYEHSGVDLLAIPVQRFKILPRGVSCLALYHYDAARASRATTTHAAL